MRRGDVCSTHRVSGAVHGRLPDRPLNRLTSAFRLFTVIPIAIVLGALAQHVFIGVVGERRLDALSTWQGASFGGLLVLAPALMIIFREKYPRWWFDFNFQLLSFMNRVGAYSCC